MFLLLPGFFPQSEVFSLLKTPKFEDADFKLQIKSNKWEAKFMEQTVACVLAYQHCRDSAYYALYANEITTQLFSEVSALSWFSLIDTK